MSETRDQAFERRIMEGFERQMARKTDAELIRGGLDSLAWLLNNVHNYDDDDATWLGMVRAAFEDRERAIEALERLKPA